MATTPTYDGSATRNLAMPLGGIGTGQISLCGDGSLRQWQIFNQINHLASPPNNFFAIRVARQEPPLNVVRILQSMPSEDHAQTVGLGNDSEVPAWQTELLQQFPGVSGTTFKGPYPVAEISYDDATLPVDIRLRAYSPFSPLDADLSSLPGIYFDFTIHNGQDSALEGVLGGASQNAVGWDGLVNILGSQCVLYGGNTNRVRTTKDRVDLVMDNPALADDHPGAGQMVLSALTPAALPYERWLSSADFIRFLQGNLVGRQPFDTGRELLNKRHHGNVLAVGQGPSPAGMTWNGGLAVPFSLAPGETVSIRFVLAWWFPNRYVNFDQYTFEQRSYGKSRFWLGNAYAERYADALEVVDRMESERESLEAATLEWVNELVASDLSPELTELMAAQGALIRSPSCFQTSDRRFYGFEGSLGVSTQMWTADYGGSCPLNCTHVWNYEQALSRWFPGLERSMRETEFEFVQAPEGYLPHRTVVPLYLRQFWDQPIGGPKHPAIDGMLGTLLKTYREVRQGAGIEWLHRWWPNIKRLTEYIRVNWDAQNTGILSGEQPNTFDISFYGENTFTGSLWLAALRAVERMAKAVDEHSYAQELARLFELGSRRYDEDLWNGEYFEQVLGPDEESLPHQWGRGCLSDQLIGQWWAHQLELGYILPEDHVKSALRAIVRYNWKKGFSNLEHQYRHFAEGDDAGLLVCTWPKGGRPDVPVRYADEVWIGSEYQLAAHCLMEGLVDEGQTILAGYWDRHDGHGRNPYNGIECGDHYVRAMAGWSVVEGLSGFRYDASTERLCLMNGMEGHHRTYPFVVASSWGSVHLSDRGAVIRPTSGQLTVGRIMAPFRIDAIELEGRSVQVVGETPFEAGTDVRLSESIQVRAGSELSLLAREDHTGGSVS